MRAKIQRAFRVIRKDKLGVVVFSGMSVLIANRTDVLLVPNIRNIWPSQRPKGVVEAAKWVPIPSSMQVWAHSCCGRKKLEAALADDEITAIEADIRMGKLVDAENDGLVAIMAHPPSCSSDQTFADFLETCIQDGRRHVKLDFKDFAAVEQCLPILAAAQPALLANGQAVWLNADVLPGPGCRAWSCTIPADAFLAAAAKHCPGAPLSLGWSVNPVGLDAYTEADCAAMAALCFTHSDRLGGKCGGVVFAVSARLADRALEPLIALLHDVPGSQLLLWTGTWEPPVRWAMLERIQHGFKQAGVSDRCGYDCRVFKASSYAERLMGSLAEAVWGSPRQGVLLTSAM